jgi:hypothetical protein
MEETEMTPEETIIARCKAAAGNLDLAQPGPKRSVVAWNVRVADEIPNQSTAEFISAAFDGMGVLVKAVAAKESRIQGFIDSIQEEWVKYAQLAAMFNADQEAWESATAEFTAQVQENARLAGELATRTQERDKVYDELIAEAVQFKDEIRTLSETVTAQKSHIAELREHNIELAREVLRANAKKPKPKKPGKRTAKKGARK